MLTAIKNKIPFLQNKVQDKQPGQAVVPDLAAPRPAQTNNSVPTNNQANNLNQQLHTAAAVPQPANPALPTEGVYSGDPEDQVIVIDLDETLIAGDKQHLEGKFAEQVNAMGDRKITHIPNISAFDLDKKKDVTFDINYVLRPGAEQLLQQLKAKGHKLIASTRNYNNYADAVVKNDPVLSKYIDSVLGRKDLYSEVNRDFKNFPNHFAKRGPLGKFKAWMHTNCVYRPSFYWQKFRNIFRKNKWNLRWNPPSQLETKKYPPDMIALLEAKGDNKLSAFRVPHMLIDNKANLELKPGKDPNNIDSYSLSGDIVQDSAKSKTFAAISPDVIRKEGEQPSEFKADSIEPKDEQGNYLWVKNVMNQVNRGWKQQLKASTGKDPVEVPVKTTVPEVAK